MLEKKSIVQSQRSDWNSCKMLSGMAETFPLRATCLITGNFMIIWCNYLHTSNRLSLDQRSVLIFLMCSINRTDGTLQYSIGLVRIKTKKCDRVLKLCLVLWLKLTLVVNQVAAPVSMMMFCLSTLKLAMDLQELTCDSILEKIT